MTKGATGALYAGLESVMLDPAFFFNPGMGLLQRCFTLARLMPGPSRRAGVAGGFRVIGGGRDGINGHRACILPYEMALNPGKMLVMARKLFEEPARTKEVVKRIHPESLDEHHPNRAAGEITAFGA